jgi:hypothetical protein
VCSNPPQWPERLGPRRKRDGRPAKVSKPLEWRRPAAAEIQECDFFSDLEAAIRAANRLARIKRFCGKE